ncbi:hypothetical protein [Pseudomonas phage Astolliot]|nr:hypothetical protein [Pseudomonas phage Astolliot]
MTTRAKEVSESYKSDEVSFDPNTPNAIAVGYRPEDTDVQKALEKAKYVAPPLPLATQTVYGITRNATDDEVRNVPPPGSGVSVNAYVSPPQLQFKLDEYWRDTIKPQIPLPVVTYGGYGSIAQMLATYGDLPYGSSIVFEEYYTYVVGWGNGSGVVGGYRRRTLIRSNNYPGDRNWVIATG